MKWINKGFTLIELIVVIAVLGVLIVGLVVVINPAMQLAKAHDATRKSDLKTVQTALEQFYNDKGYFPKYDTNQINGYYNSCVSEFTCWITSGDANFLLGQNNTSYLATLPQDPTYSSSGDVCSGTASSGAYGYYSPDGSTYYLFTKLENTQDPEIQKGQPHSALDSSGSNIIAAAGSNCATWANYVITNK